MRHTVTNRFLQYVTIDTQSDPHSPTYPSTEKQKNLSRLLVQELLEMGIKDAHLDEFGYVYATIPSNMDKKVPTICFCSHVDTSPDCSGKEVKPIVHKNYDGTDIILPDDPTQIIKASEHPDLNAQIGNDIITASGTTLLGADNKSGVAAIMDAAYQLMQHPEMPHGTIKILFTPDEEIGRGTAKVDMQKLDADYGYTIDGESLGTLEDETFSADGVTITIHGVSAHPGFAKGKLVNALKIAGEILAALPKNKLSPETTEGREGFIHPVEMSGIAEKATLHFIIRDFTTKKLQAHEAVLQKIMDKILAKYPQARADFQVKEQYRNMKEILDQHPQVTAIAMKAMRQAGLQPKQRSIRGGTDGSRLSFMGLPCPNIFAGEHAFHSKLEWVSVQDMEKAVQTIVNVCKEWVCAI
jgi:tripeptide aminopeptidase